MSPDVETDANNDSEFNDSERAEEVSYDSDGSSYGSKQDGKKRKRPASGNGRSSKRARILVINVTTRNSEEEENASGSSASSAIDSLRLLTVAS